MTIEINLTKGFVAIIDDIDNDLVNYSFYAGVKSNSVYAQFGINDKYLHRIIMSRILKRELNNKEQVDHKNKNTLDNTRNNLRLATNSENQMNKSKYKNNKSGYKGVHWSKIANKWTSQIRKDNKIYHLGLFNTPEEAYIAYCEAAKKLHGKFARYD